MVIKSKNEKNVGIQLLRIVLFFMIVALHVVPDGLVTNEIPAGTFNWYFCVLFRLFVSTAVITFVIIGGYVANPNSTFDFKKSLKRFSIPLLMCLPFLIYINCLGFGTDNIISTNIINFLTFLGAYYHLWYIILYFAVVCIFPLIKEGFNKLPRKSLRVILIIMLFLCSINSFYPQIVKINFFNGLFNDMLLTFLTVYSIGYYIKKYDIKINTVLNIFLLIICYIIYVYMYKFTISYINYNVNLLTNNNILCIAIAILFLLLFSKLKIKSSIIDKIGNLTYGAYIIHTFFITMITVVFNYLLYFSNKFYFLIIICFILIV